MQAALFAIMTKTRLDEVVRCADPSNDIKVVLSKSGRKKVEGQVSALQFDADKTYHLYEVKYVVPVQGTWLLEAFVHDNAEWW